MASNDQQIVPCLWFDNNAEEAVNGYVKIFAGIGRDSRIDSIAYYSKEGAEASGMSEGMVMFMSFRLNGQKFTALNGGPIFKFSPAISLMIECKNQKEIDWFWDNLGDGGQYEQCGWLKDKYGLSWQIIPENMNDLMNSGDKYRDAAAMRAMLSMKKIDVTALTKASLQA